MWACSTLHHIHTLTETKGEGKKLTPINKSEHKLVKENKKVQSSLKTIKGGQISKIGKGYKADKKSGDKENKKVIYESL